MKYTNIDLINRERRSFAISNEFPDVIALTDAIEDAKDSEDLLEKLKGITSYIKTFSLDRVTDTYIRYKLIAHMCDNEYFLIVYKK